MFGKDILQSFEKNQNQLRQIWEVEGKFSNNKSQDSYQVVDDESTMNSQLEEITMNIQYPINMGFKFSQESSQNLHQLNEDTQMDEEVTPLEDKSEYTFGKKETT